MNTRKLFRILEDEVARTHKEWIENDRAESVEKVFRGIFRRASQSAAQVLFDEMMQKKGAADSVLYGYDWDPVLKCKFCKELLKDDERFETGYGNGVYGCRKCTLDMENKRRGKKEE